MTGENTEETTTRLPCKSSTYEDRATGILSTWLKTDDHDDDDDIMMM